MDFDKAKKVKKKNNLIVWIKGRNIILLNINIKTAEALKNKYGEGYKGILYGGFMATSNGVKLIEYNSRFGDPEAMNVLSILETEKPIKWILKILMSS